MRDRKGNITVLINLDYKQIRKIW